jgi:type II secretory ATPase GspE/PulE/Tfp pilus assembly ATPase PilB-like protein
MADEGAGLIKKLKDIRREAEERDAKRRAEKAGAVYADLGKTPVNIEAVMVIPEAEAKAAKAVGIQLKDKELAVVFYDPAAPEAKKLIEELAAKKYKVKPFVVTMSALEQAWSYYQFVAAEKKGITGNVEIDQENFKTQVEKFKTFQIVQAALADLDYAKESVSALLEIILAGALSTRTSDIHYEAEEKSARIRYRIDGLLHDIALALPKKNYESLVSRIKLLCNMKLNVHSEPQDGRFTIKIPEKEIEMRVSIIPSEFGETIVMRILDPAGINVTLPQLGLRADDLAMVQKELLRPNGLILNTGPTGSGKTTTLYAFLRTLVNPEVKIITVEDPIEYRILGIEQTQVDPGAGYTFAGGLRAIVRQDPDAILVGEIRDLETADIALQAALTGHLVLSTLHTNSAVGAVPRLVDLGVKPASIGPALTLIIAQRLVRKLCESCRKPVELTPDMKTKIDNFFKKLPVRVDRAPYATPTLFSPNPGGCEICNGFGYKGRRGIFEFFKGGPDLEVIILKEVSEASLRELSKKQEMVTMQEDGILKVLTGMTTFEEVEGTTGPIEW